MSKFGSDAISLSELFTAFGITDKKMSNLVGKTLYDTNGNTSTVPGASSGAPLRISFFRGKYHTNPFIAPKIVRYTLFASPRPPAAARDPLGFKIDIYSGSGGGGGGGGGKYTGEPSSNNRSGGGGGSAALGTLMYLESLPWTSDTNISFTDLSYGQGGAAGGGGDGASCYFLNCAGQWGGPGGKGGDSRVQVIRGGGAILDVTVYGSNGGGGGEGGYQNSNNGGVGGSAGTALVQPYLFSSGSQYYNTIYGNTLGAMGGNGNSHGGSGTQTGGGGAPQWEFLGLTAGGGGVGGGGNGSRGGNGTPGNTPYIDIIWYYNTLAS